MPTFLTFESSEVCELVGIGPFLLNKFVEGKTYGIQPSVRRGKGRGGRRLFGPDDVFGIALVWWLFETGLRSGVIQYVLNEICAPAKGVASEAAKKLVRRKIQTVLVLGKPRRMDPRLKMPRHTVHLVTEEKPNVIIGPAAPIRLGIYFGGLYENLLGKMKSLTGLPEGE